MLATSLSSEVRFQPAIDRFVAEFDVSVPTAEALFDDLKAWFQLNKKLREEGLRPIEMRSAMLAIDEMWHVFALYGQDYEDFCQEVAGRPVLHAPNAIVKKKPSEAALEKKDAAFEKTDAAPSSELERERYKQEILHVIEHLGPDMAKRWYRELHRSLKGSVRRRRSWRLDRSQLPISIDAKRLVDRYPDFARIAAYRDDRVIARFIKHFGVTVRQARGLFLEVRLWLWTVDQLADRPGSLVLPRCRYFEQMLHNFMLFQKDFKRFCAEHLSRIPDYRPNPFPPDKAPADRLRYSMRVAAKVVGFSVANRWYGDTSADRQSQRTVEVPRLQALLAPIDASRFYEEDWGRRVVQVSGAEDRFRDLLTDEEVELIRRGRIGRGSAERIGEKNEPYRAEGVKHTSEDVTSFRIRRAQSLLGPLRKLATNWCEELGEEININVYVSPSKNTPGLAPHSDAYDIFVLQVSGLKHWTFSGIAGVDGLREPLGPREDRPGTYGTDGSLTMRPGDLLYIPMGMRHVAIADGHIPSVHLTIGIHRKTG
ncbi:MAG: cupin domain-containing protein, partial [Myxococcota bacterium]